MVYAITIVIVIIITIVIIIGIDFIKLLIIICNFQLLSKRFLLLKFVLDIIFIFIIFY